MPIMKIPRNCLFVLLTWQLLAASPAAAAGICPVPELAGPSTADAEFMSRSREALDMYEACLREHAEVLALFDADAAFRLELQREAAARLKRTLDAWIRAQQDAEERRPAL